MKLIHKIADCDFCPGDLEWHGTPAFAAEYDAPAARLRGSWANMCAEHWRAEGASQIGYRLTRDPDHPDLAENQSTSEKRASIMAAVEAGDFDAAEDLIGDGDFTDYL